jgi:hypothetical protein
MAVLPRTLAIDPFVEIVPVMLIAPETTSSSKAASVPLYF